jgi:hypothetical protein
MVLRLPQLSALVVACLLAGAIGGASALLLRNTQGLPRLPSYTRAHTAGPASATLPKGATLIARNRAWPITHTGVYHIALPFPTAARHLHGFGVGYRIIGAAAVTNLRLLPSGNHTDLTFHVLSYQPGAQFHLLMADAHR